MLGSPDFRPGVHGRLSGLARRPPDRGDGLLRLSRYCADIAHLVLGLAVAWTPRRGNSDVPESEREMRRQEQRTPSLEGQRPMTIRPDDTSDVPVGHANLSGPVGLSLSPTPSIRLALPVQSLTRTTFTTPTDPPRFDGGAPLATSPTPHRRRRRRLLLCTTHNHHPLRSLRSSAASNVTCPPSLPMAAASSGV